MALSDSRILMIDDHVDLAEDLMEILEGVGATVAHARTGAEALKLAETPFDVALLDVKLPDATGLQLLPQLRAAGDGLAEVLLVTGHASIEDAIEAVAAGAYAYVLKPFNPDALLADVERALRQVRSTREAEALRQTLGAREARLRILVKTVQALLIEMDAEGVILQANPAACHAVGITSGDLLGRNWIEEFIPEKEQRTVQELVGRVADDGAEIHRESRILNSNGTKIRERWVSWTLSRLHEEDATPGEGVRIYASGIETTEIKRLERRSRVTEKLAAVGTLAAGLAHEIRNPLNAATLQLRLLERGLRRLAEAEPLTEPLGLVQDELGRLSRLLHEFLTFARPGELQTMRVELGSVATKVVGLEGPAAEEAGVTVNLILPEDGTIEIEADREKVYQVLFNLVHNAVEAMRGDGGEVEVFVEDAPGGARLRVNDTGPGIPEENLSRIFEPFFSTKPGGTGLGMAIVHSLVSVHGGTIEVHSEGEGTQVEVFLPDTPPTHS